MDNITLEKTFQFHVPIDLIKAGEDENGDYKIAGLASTEHEDLQGEIVRKNGLDISYLKAGRGLFNFDHQKGPQNIIGLIEDAKIDKAGLKVEGYLFRHQPSAQGFVNILKSLKDKDKNRVQMSIEGKIVKRGGETGKTIEQARVEKIALTLDPVNPHTYANLAKSLVSNVEANPSEAQKKSGNYKKDHISYKGLDISIESPKGSVRSGKSRYGVEWKTEMKHDYGYFRGIKGKDKDHLDVFVGDKDSDDIFVIDQVDPKTEKFDEHKVMLGFESAKEAKDAYHANYEKNWQGFNGMSQLTFNDFRDWTKKGVVKDPIKKDLEEAQTPELGAGDLGLMESQSKADKKHADGMKLEGIKKNEGRKIKILEQDLRHILNQINKLMVEKDIKNLSTENSTLQNVPNPPKIEVDENKFRNLMFVLTELIIEESTEVDKALTAGTGYTGSPSAMSGGAALGTESLDLKPKKIRKSLDTEELVKEALEFIKEYPPAYVSGVISSVCKKDVCS